MPQVEQFTNGKSFNLTGAITSGATTLTPPSYTGWPATGQFRVKIDSELILITDASTHPWPISRHLEGTTAAAHVLGSAVIQQLTAGGIQNLIAVDQAGTLAATGQEINFQSGATVTQVGAKIQVDIGAGGEQTGTDFKATGLTGATAASRYVGSTASGAPASGTFLLGDFVIDQSGKVWICTVAGSPGTWAVVGTGLTNPMSGVGDIIVGTTAGAPSRLAVGSTGQVLQIVTGTPVWGGVPPAFSGEVSAPDFKPTGLTGSTAASRYVGATGSGAPSTGAHAIGDWGIDQSGSLWICTSAGTPGTWSQVKGNPTFSVEVTVPDLKVAGLTGATAVGRLVGATASGAPVSGTFALGDVVIDQTGSLWICTVAGTPGTWVQSASGGTFGGQVQGTDFKATGLAGAASATRLVGANASSHPASGTFVAGDIAVDLTGSLWVCTVGGSPGTWVAVAGGLSNPMNTVGDLIIGGSSGTPTRLAAGSNGYVLEMVSGSPAWALVTGTGTVTSVAMTVPSDMSIGGSPVTAAGTLALTRNAQTGNKVMASPSGGGSGTPDFRVLVSADLPTAPTVTGEATALDFKASGKTGATAASRYVGATASGAPASGTFAVGDFTIDQTGHVWVCTVAGTPGTWVTVGGAAGSLITRCALGSEPGSPTTGDMVVYTNAPFIATWSGSAWLYRGPIFEMTPPVSGSFSWMNQGGASVITTNGGVYLSAPSSVGDGFRARVVAAPAAPYVVTTYLMPNMALHGGAGNDQVAGFVWWDNAGTSFVAAGMYYNSGGNPDIDLLVAKYTNYTVFSASYFQDRFLPSRSGWWQFGDDNTNRYINISQDGQNWIRIWSVGRTDFITPTRVGFMVRNSGSTYDLGLNVLSWTGA